MPLLLLRQIGSTYQASSGPLLSSLEATSSRGHPMLLLKHPPGYGDHARAGSDYEQGDVQQLLITPADDVGAPLPGGERGVYADIHPCDWSKSPMTEAAGISLEDPLECLKFWGNSFVAGTQEPFS